MLKYLSICTALTVLGAGSVSAQQQETVLQRIEVPNAGFNIVLAVAKSNRPTLSLGGVADPNIVYLADGELVYAYTGHLQELLDVGALMVPACTFHVDRKDYSPLTPVTVYVIPKGEIPLPSDKQ